MSSFEKLCCAFGEVTSAALTDEFAMQTRQPQSSFFLQTRNSGYCSLANGRCIKNTDINFYER